MAEPRFLTQVEAAAHVRISVRFLRSETVAGAIPAARVGKKLLYEVSDLDEYVRRHRLGKNEPDS